MKKLFIFFLAAFGLLIWGSNLLASDFLKWPDGRRVLVVQANEQVDLSNLRSGIKGVATDRRFKTNQAMFLANEIYLSGTEFFLRASEKKIPFAHDLEFSFITNVEAYWYSRYNLLSLNARSRAGIGIVHGPYLDILAQEATDLNQFGRNRGEVPFSNKDVMLTRTVANFLARSGMPRKFDNAVPLMLEFEAGNPHFPQAIDLSADSTGRAAYFMDFETLKWSHGGMDTDIDMGGVGQSLLKKVLWAKFFLRRNHQDDDFPGEVFLGNNAEDGFRGAILTLDAVSTFLMAKAALFTDAKGKKLMGLNPVRYDPGQGLKYLPHKVDPTLMFTGDMPVRHYDMKIGDPTSQLWDQASWLWATTEFFDFANPRKKDNWNQVFGYQTPYDGSVMEQKYSLLAQALANVFLENIEAMHSVGGVLVSSWSPGKGAGSTIAMADLSLTVVALSSYVEFMDLEPGRQAKALNMARAQADFLLSVVNTDGSFVSAYNASTGTPAGTRDMTSQAFAIRALLAVYHLTGEQKYLAAARRTSKTWNRDFWDDQAWLYRNQPGSAKVVYTPVDVAAALAALREMILVDGDMELFDRFKKFFVQSVDASGLMQSEDIFTGEEIDQVRAGNYDSDGDGIPFMTGGHGSNGIDTVFASKVEFDLGSSFSGTTSLGERPAPFTGKDIYDTNCAVCHGVAGIGNEGPRLVNNPFVQMTGKSGVINTISAGRVRVGMPAWDGILSAQEIEKVVAYIQGLETKETRTSP